MTGSLSTARRFKPFSRSFYAAAADEVARLLLGHFLVRHTAAGLVGGVIVETEAYLADDPASHGFGRQTERNRAMYGPPGHAYVYFIYGNHYCFNAVCQPSGCPEAVLVRAVAPTLGVDWMRARRPGSGEKHLTSGPAKLCGALDIDRSLDAADLCDAHSPVYIARNARVEEWLEQQGPVVTTTRVGITKAAEAPLRFYLRGSEFVSRRAPDAR